jgi:hypothetical protein
MATAQGPPAQTDGVGLRPFVEQALAGVQASLSMLYQQRLVPLQLGNNRWQGSERDVGRRSDHPVRRSGQFGVADQGEQHLQPAVAEAPARAQGDLLRIWFAALHQDKECGSLQVGIARRIGKLLLARLQAIRQRRADMVGDQQHRWLAGIDRLPQLRQHRAQTALRQASLDDDRIVAAAPPRGNAQPGCSLLLRPARNVGLHGHRQAVRPQRLHGPFENDACFCCLHRAPPHTE